MIAKKTITKYKFRGGNMLEDYKKDYSAYCLRVELKYLGREKQSFKSNPEYLEVIDKQMNDIRSTLELLKKKYGLKEGEEIE
jgi:hypothetical protein